MRYRFSARVFAVLLAACFAAAGQAQTMSVDRLIAFIESSAKFIQEQKMTDYKLILVNNAPTIQDYRTLGGATSTGEFGSLLRDIFEPYTQARFEWDHWGLLRGRRVMAFAYHVEQARSRWSIEWEHKEHIVPAYSGLVEVDQDTHVVMRVTLVAENIPPSFPVKHAETIL